MNVYEKLQHPLALVIFMITLFSPILVGFLTQRRTRNQSDFFIGGRTMNRLVVPHGLYWVFQGWPIKSA